MTSEEYIRQLIREEIKKHDDRIYSAQKILLESMDEQAPVEPALKHRFWIVGPDNWIK